MNTLLIVEDEKMIRQGIKAIVQRSSISINNIIECKNGQEALEIIENQVVDVMITDIRMPKMDGITLVKEMQKCSHVPLTVVVSGYDDFSYAVELLRHGVKDYILKPIERTQITNILVNLEAEVQSLKEKQHKMLNIEYQQLKYLILGKDIQPEKMNPIIQQFENNFFEDEYVVCCSNYVDALLHEQEGIIYLDNVDKQGIFIVEQSKLDGFMQSELCNFYIGCSKSYIGFQELNKAYGEALEARKKAFALGEHVVVYSDDNIKYEAIEEQELNKIVQMLGTSKIAEVLKAVDHIYFKLMTQRISPDIFSQSMNSLLDKIVSAYKNAINISKKEISLYQEIYTYNTALEFINFIKESFVGLNQKLLTDFDDYRNKQKIKQAILYIEENYYKNLNMAVVSNYISMNYSLFSFAFKQYSGYNFVNYLRIIRITEAKRLLETTDMHVNNIGQAVGYENDKHFMKIFKSFCGVSPTEYRKNALLREKGV